MMKMKMPKVTNKKQKRKSHQPVEKENHANKMVSDSINNFIEQHKNEANINQSQLLSLNKHSEQFQFVDTCKKSTLEELKRSLDTKSNALDEMKGKYEKLLYTFRNVHNTMVLQNKKCVELEASYEQTHKDLIDKIQHLSENMANVNTLFSAKEAECAAYLKDIRTQLEEANSKNVQSENEISELKAKISELEEILETTKEQETAEKQNLKKQLEEETEKNEKKLNKKHKRIIALEKIINTLRNESKALRNSLELEGHKIRDLQRVLNRPINRSSPIHENNENEQRQVTQVEPFITVQDTNSSSSHPASPEIGLNTQVNRAPIQNDPIPFQPFKRPLPVYKNDNNADINNVSRNQPQEDLNCLPSSNAGLRSENRPTSSVNTNQLKRSSAPFDYDTSEDLYPTFARNTNQKLIFKGVKRTRK